MYCDDQDETSPEEQVMPTTTHTADNEAAASTPATGGHGVHQHSYIANNTKDGYLKRLRRIEGQARGLQRMVEEEQYCIDILTQISAMTKALEAVALGLLDEHMAHCVADAVAAGGDEAQLKLKEASDAIARLVRS
jgi:DNA-binding FrmR family transcriptional regulator